MAASEGVACAAVGARLFIDDNSSGGLPRNGQWTGTTPLAYALSRAGRTPARSITWFQANEACRASGKRLPSGDEWLAAARGTPDPGVNEGTAPGNTRCHTLPTPMAAAARLTGLGSSCQSAWGAQDMIGNLSEWTNEWQFGAGAMGAAPATVNPFAARWPSDYAGDSTSNINGSVIRSTNGGTDIAVGLPTAVNRGGGYFVGSFSGVYNVSADFAPSVWNSDVGFRCVIPN